MTRPADDLLTLVEDLRGTLDCWVAAGWDVLPPEVPWLAPAGLAPIASSPRPPRPPVSTAPPPRPPPTAAPPAGPTVAPVTRPQAPSPAVPPGGPTPPRPALVATPVPSTAPAAPAALFGGKWAAFRESPEESLAKIAASAATCSACNRCTTRSRVHFGAGAARAALLVLTGPPSAAEETEDRLLVGPAGEMFDRMLVNVLSYERADIHLAPVLLCRGGVASPEELERCSDWLRQRVRVVAPRAILVMGSAIGQALRLPPVGRWTRFLDVDTLVTLHPDELVDEPARKRECFEHLKLVRARIG